MTERLALPQNPRILVVALRRLGDVLLTTPLICSVKRAWPDAKIDVLVFADTAPILDGNPDIDTIVVMPNPASFGDSAALAARLWRRYALAITTQAGDRPSFFAIIAGRKRIGLVEQRLIGRIKAMLLTRSADMRNDIHRVEETLLLADLLGIEKCGQIMVPRATLSGLTPDKPYAVIHAAPFFRYKQWHTDGWRAVAAHLTARGFEIVATGGPADAERRYLDDIWTGTPILRMDGKLSWPQLSGLLSGASVYVGPDTSVTHLAAGTGCPTIAMYGPTDPKIWGPWPADGLASPWQSSDNIQRRGNVWLVQNPRHCMPCRLEGCLRHLDSHSVCLDELPVERMTAAIDEALTPDVTGNGPGWRGGTNAAIQSPNRAQ